MPPPASISNLQVIPDSVVLETNGSVTFTYSGFIYADALEIAWAASAGTITSGGEYRAPPGSGYAIVRVRVDAYGHGTQAQAGTSDTQYADAIVGVDIVPNPFEPGPDALNFGFLGVAGEGSFPPGTPISFGTSEEPKRLIAGAYGGNDEVPGYTYTWTETGDGHLVPYILPPGGGYPGSNITYVPPAGPRDAGFGEVQLSVTDGSATVSGSIGVTWDALGDEPPPPPEPDLLQNIYIGSDPVDAVYIGSDQVDAVYVGNVKVFG